MDRKQFLIRKFLDVSKGDDDWDRLSAGRAFVAMIKTELKRKGEGGKRKQPEGWAGPRLAKFEKQHGT